MTTGAARHRRRRRRSSPTTTLTSTTTTSTTPAAVAADRTQDQGYLNPPLQTSNKFGFTGSGAMEISVVWSGSTYLTMEVTCPSGEQTSGGLGHGRLPPRRQRELHRHGQQPTSESTSLTYTISIGPAGG